MNDRACIWLSEVHSDFLDEIRSRCQQCQGEGNVCLAMQIWALEGAEASQRTRTRDT